jgi:hypothetical protein
LNFYVNQKIKKEIKIICKNMNDKRQLLCTFSLKSSFLITIEEIKNFYVVLDNRFFVFLNVNSPQDVFITYNILCENEKLSKFSNTISIHRKKDYNVLYTLNSMNQLIKNENGGILDKKFSVDWIKYKISFIMADKFSVRIVPIQLLEIIH